MIRHDENDANSFPLRNKNYFFCCYIFVPSIGKIRLLERLFLIHLFLLYGMSSLVTFLLCSESHFYFFFLQLIILQVLVYLF
jgi:hypothetical protein